MDTTENSGLLRKNIAWRDANASGDDIAADGFHDTTLIPIGEIPPVVPPIDPGPGDPDPGDPDPEDPDPPVSHDIDYWLTYPPEGGTPGTSTVWNLWLTCFNVREYVYANWVYHFVSDFADIETYGYMQSRLLNVSNTDPQVVQWENMSGGNTLASRNITQTSTPDIWSYPIIYPNIRAYQMLPNKISFELDIYHTYTDIAVFRNTVLLFNPDQLARFLTDIVNFTPRMVTESDDWLGANAFRVYFGVEPDSYGAYPSANVPVGRISYMDFPGISYANAFLAELLGGA